MTLTSPETTRERTQSFEPPALDLQPPAPTEPSTRVSGTAIAITVVTLSMVAAGVVTVGGGRPLLSLVSGGWERMVGPVILGFVAAVFILEQVMPAVRRPVLARGHVQDLLYLVLYAAAVVPLVVVIDLGFLKTVQHLAPWLEAPGIGLMPRLSVLVVAVLLMDAFNWAAHWANHRWTPFWRFHAVHHSQEELSILTSFRAHPLVHTSFLISVIPVVVLPSSAGLPAAVITVYICLSSLPHANLDWTFGPVGKVIISPAYHRLHHASEGRIDVNLGTVFTFWDLLTKRAVFPQPGHVPLATGLDRRQIPVEQDRPGVEVIGVFATQLSEPFFASTSGSASPSWVGAKYSLSSPTSPTN